VGTGETAYFRVMARLPGPNGPIEYERDALGYPSIRAASLAEGTYALGYLHATDRLVQVTITALAARGELMSVLGDLPLARLVDRSTRALALTRDVAEQASLCDAPSQALLAQYSAGFNAGAARRGWPLVLRVLGVEPFVASAATVISIYRFVTYFSLTSMQLCAELIVAELVARGAPPRLFERLLGENARGLELDALSGLQIPPEYSFFGATFGSGTTGSNAFAVSPQRSASGGALLMGEFHMELGRSPPPLYATHLALPDGEYLSGMTIPGLAWFVAGRTRHVGWSYTFAHADNVDFMVERVQGEKYLAAGEYKPLRHRVETVKLKKKPSETWEFWENDYGTLLGDARKDGLFACVRATGLSETHRAFSAARRVLDCRSAADLIEIQREVRSVSLEAIIADRHGHIASVVTGQVDQRPRGWNGVYPRKAWDLAERTPGVLDEEQRPLAKDPECGYIASANQGGHGVNRAGFCSLPEPLHRFERINELLAQKPKHDLKSMLRISYDVFDAGARRLLAVWAPLLPKHPLATALTAWAAEQRDPSLLRLFLRLQEEVTFLLLEEDLDSPTARRFGEWSAFVFFQPQLDALLALEQPERLDEATLARLLGTAFATALEDYQAFEMPIRFRFKHLVTQGKSPAFLGFDSRELELPGGPSSPFQCRVSPVGSERLIHAPAFHLLFDMSQDGAAYNLPGGASESRWGPGYGLGLEAWLRGELAPLGPASASPRGLSLK
jgi:penicillin amidase